MPHDKRSLLFLALFSVATCLRVSRRGPSLEERPYLRDVTIPHNIVAFPALRSGIRSPSPVSNQRVHLHDRSPVGEIHTCILST